LTNLPVPVRIGYNFIGWFTAATGGIEVTTSTAFVGSTTVYARWREVTVGSPSNAPPATPGGSNSTGSGSASGSALTSAEIKILTELTKEQRDKIDTGIALQILRAVAGVGKLEGDLKEIFETNISTALAIEILRYVAGQPSFIDPNAYILTVNHYYDDGFELRFQNASTNINNYQNTVSSILRDVFRLLIINDTIEKYDSTADKHRRATINVISHNALGDNCPCKARGVGIEDCEIRHLITSDFQRQLGDINTSQIAWSGHVFIDNKREKARSCFWGDPWYLIYMSVNNVTGNAPNYTTLSDNDVISQRYIHTLLHEIAHHIGANDHYCYERPTLGIKCTNDYCFPHTRNGTLAPPCVMTSRREDFLELDRHALFCGDRDCVGLITANLRTNFRRDES
jgi:uncharacterized repeat protein (TIGR02543 family)